VENIISRHRNLTLLALVLFGQILGLAVQVRKGADGGSTRLIRVWAVSAITPFEKAVVYTSRWFSGTWRNYVYLRSVRVQNEKLRDELERMRLEHVRMVQDAGQARRLQTLLAFKEQFISQTMAAQVISTTGSEYSRGVYIDKGSKDGIKADMPVITPDGVVGKVIRVYPSSSLVLQINDPSSGAGVILEKSRLQGILKGSASGETFLANIMADETIEPGERLLTSGGDRVYPKGLAAGTVVRVNPAGTFLNVEVKPAAQLNRLEEVLVITKIVEKAPEVNEQNTPLRAVDILAQRLPSVPPKPEGQSSSAIPAPVHMDPPAKKPAAAAASAGSTTSATGASKPGAEPKPKPAPPPETGGQTTVEPKREKPPTSANSGQMRGAAPSEKNPARAKSAAEQAKPENPAKDTPR
jgi:rod shape-determining protein MreC